MKTRTEILNFLAQRYELDKYLEVGMQYAENNFDKVTCSIKVAVDPSTEAKENFYSDPARKHFSHFYNDTSDEFFDSWIRRPGEFVCTVKENNFDLIFIDGLHTAEQVEKDFRNAIKILNPGGFIVMHDCNPEREEYARVPRETKVWNGDVFQFASRLYLNKFYTVDIDHGCGVYQHDGQQPIIINRKEKLRWSEFQREKEDCLNLISWSEFVAHHES